MLYTNDKTVKVKVGNTYIGGGADITVQSMLSIPAHDIDGNVAQALRLEKAGCDIVRVTVPDKQAIKTVEALKKAIKIPLVADIHFDYRLALESVAAGVDKIRINPGNIGSDDKVKAVADACRKAGVPIRIGVNSGSLEKEILAKYGAVTPEAMVESGLYHISLLEKFDFGDIVLSLKSSDTFNMYKAYELAAEKCKYPLHLGVTEAGTESMGVIKSAAGIGGLLLRGIGNTIRISLTDDPVKEVEAGIKPIGTLIEEQSFEVALNDWGTITFAPYAPENNSFLPDGWNPDVRFYLMNDDEVLYEFPGWNEEHNVLDLFLAVSAIAFKDYNDDGLLDVITLCEYETMSGDGYQLGRIYFQLDDREGFEEDSLLTEYLTQNYKNDSIATILETKDEYWDYKDSLDGHRSVYNQLTIMAENSDIWTEDYESMGEVVHYAVMDLDRNGRQELIVSGIGGTGLYTTNRVYEINEDYDGLNECILEFDDGVEPDLAYDVWDTYMDEDYQFHYVVMDVERNNPYGSYEKIYDMSLQNGVVKTILIAAKETIIEEGEILPFIYTDSAGNVISEGAFENAVMDYFAECEKTVHNIGWQNIEELGQNTKEIRNQLEESYDTFWESF